MTEEGGWYFSAPWEPVSIRRGDALGFRAGADYFAELLAPGLSNGTTDARWITLLSWCLRWSHVAWRNAAGRDLSRPAHQLARYAWLRPLELLWVARTLKFVKHPTGQLRGRRSIQRWLDNGQQAPDFAMSPDQFGRYRQVGMYGAYRVVFRTLPGLTTGDGWTPGATALELARIANDSLPVAARLKELPSEKGTKWGHWTTLEARYWVERGWKSSLETAGGFLPTPADASRKPLPRNERDLLEPALFGIDSIRRVTAEVLAKAKEAKSHLDLCEALASSSELSKKLAPASLAALPTFSRFADASMHAMRGLWNEINQDDTNQSPPIEKLAQLPELKSRFSGLRQAGEAWLSAGARTAFPHGQPVTQLATAMRAASTPVDELRALATHHYERGGGRRWFAERNGTLVPLVAATGIAASDYRFRLGALSRLAAQCNIASMDNALNVIAQVESDDDEGGAE